MYPTQYSMPRVITMKRRQISLVLQDENDSPSTNDRRTPLVEAWNNIVSGNYFSSMWHNNNNPLSVTVINHEILNSDLLENPLTKTKVLSYIPQEEKLNLEQKSSKDYIESMFPTVERAPKMNQDWDIVDDLNLIKMRNDVNLLKNSGDTYKDNSTMESHSVPRLNVTEKTTAGNAAIPVDPQNWEVDIHEDTDVESFLVVSHSDVPATLAGLVTENPVSRFSSVCRNAWNSLTSRLRCNSEQAKMSAKRPLYLTKHHCRRVNAVAMGRGRGRAKCQLRRSGVSQTICRKECIKSDDHEAWQNNLVDVAPNDCLLDNKLEFDNLGFNMDTADSTQVTKRINSPAMSNSSRATPAKGKSKARKKKKTKTRNVIKVRYISSSLKMNDYCEDSDSEMPSAQEDSFRSRTLSESSKDDGWIVFENDDDELPEKREKQGATEYPTRTCHVPNSPMRMNDSTCEDSNSEAHDVDEVSFRLRISSESSTDFEDGRSFTDEQEAMECPRMRHDCSVQIQMNLFQRRRFPSDSSDDSDTSNSFFASEEIDDIDACDEISFRDGDSQLGDDSVVFADEDNEELTAQTKKVSFDSTPVVHVMVTWNYAYRAARRGPWEQFARDNERFRGRINSIANVLDPILRSEHRSNVWQERFAIPE